MLTNSTHKHTNLRIKIDENYTKTELIIQNSLFENFERTSLAISRYLGPNWDMFAIFIKESVQNINDQIDFSSDPLFCFQINRFMHSLALGVLIPVLLWSTNILLNLDTIFVPKLSSVSKSTSHHLMLLLCIFVIADLIIS